MERVDVKKFGADVKRFMKRTGLGAPYLEKQSGVSKSTIYRLTEGWNGSVRKNNLAKLANVTDLNIEDYIIEEPKEEPTEELPFEDGMNYDKLYKTIYGAMYAVMDQFWGK